MSGRGRVGGEPRRGRRGGARWLLLIGLLLLAVLGADFFARPAVESMASHSVRVYAMRVINSAMSAELGEQGVAYGEMVTIVQNGEGNVTSIQTNMAEINRLKSRLTERVIGEMEKEENRSLRIHAGTLVGSQLLTGRGPEIEVRLVPAGHMTSRIYNEFRSAGINQTLHRIMLEIGVEIDAIFPGYIVRTETVTSYCIAETVIVGSIPERYIQIAGADIPSLGGQGAG